MSRTTIRVVMAAMAVCFTAVTSTAQTTTTSTQTKKFEVIAVNGNDLVVKLPEGTREIQVPDDFRFTVDGQQLAARDLKPGMKGTATITTKTTVTPVVVTEVKNGEVVQASGSSLLVRTDQGFKQFTEGDVEKRGIKMVKDGVPAQFSDFHSGDRLSATIVTTHPPKVMTQQQVDATLAKAAPASGAAGAAAAPRATSGSAAGAPAASRSTSGSSAGGSTSGSAAAPAEAPAARKLPKTGSAWPLLALASILSIAMGLTLTVRRHVVR
jgi:LPXTG-motif cell wall-anchored protein